MGAPRERQSESARGVGRRGSRFVERLEPRRFLAAGTLDPSFGAGGAALAGLIGSPGQQPARVTIQSDGKLVTAGSADADLWRLALTRSNATGTPDTTFDTDGQASLPVPMVRGGAVTDLLIDASGRAVACGLLVRSDFTTDGFVARFTTAGAPDTTFDGDGLFTFDLGGDESFDGLALQSDGKIVLGGGSFLSGQSRCLLVRLNANGTPDSAFGTAGVATVNFSTGTEYLTDIAIDAVGRIFGVGAVRDAVVGSTQFDWLLARFSSTGAADTTFDGDGFRAFRLDGGMDEATSLVLSGSAVVVGGWRSTNDLGFPSRASDAVVARFAQADGAPDTTFAGTGFASFDFGSTSSVSRAEQVFEVTLDGTAVLAGGNTTVSGTSSTRDETLLFRLTSAGALDVSFDADGRAPAALFGGLGLARQSDGRAVLVTTTAPSLTSSSTNSGYRLARFTTAGAVDTSFGTSGAATTYIRAAAVDAGRAAVVQADGRVIVVGPTATGAGRFDDFGAVRFLANGQPDTTYGTPAAGGIQTDFGVSDSEFAADAALQADGKLIIVGSRDRQSTTPAGERNVAFARYTTTGALDAGFFSASGFGTLSDFNPVSSGPTLIEEASAVAIHTDGKITIAGYSNDGGDRAAIARLLATGAPDTTFGTGGKASTTLIGRARDVAVDGSGRAVMIGYASGTAAVVRLGLNGAPDTTFSGDGRVDLTAGFGSARILVQPDGKIVAAWPAGSGNALVLARLDANGVLDPSFDADGFVQVPTAPFGFAEVDALVRRPDGTLAMLAGTVILQFNADGSPDTTFGTAGMTTFSVAGRNVTSRDLAVRPSDGRLVVAGQAVTTGWSLDGDYLAGLLSATVPPGDRSASGTVFNDLNRNGTRDPGEPGLGGRTIYADIDNDGIRDASEPSVTTLPDGSFALAGLEALTYTLRQVLPAGWTQSSPTGSAGLSANFRATGGNIAGLTFGAWGPDNTAPTVTGASFDFETRHAAVLTFSEDVSASLTASDVTVLNVGTSLPVSGAGWTLSDPIGTPTVATITFSPRLPDGNYRVTLPAGSVSDAAGNPLAGSFALNLFILTGDANRDRSVNIGDFSVLAARFNQPGTFSQGDFDYSGTTEIGDFSLLASRFNTTLPAPRPALPGAAAMPAPGRAPFAGHAIAPARLIDLVDLLPG